MAVNYDVIIILLPLALVGTLIGVLINQIFPQLILSISTVLLFIYVINKSFTKGMSLRAKEKQSSQEIVQPLIKSLPQDNSNLYTSFNSPSPLDLSQEALVLIRKEGSHWQPKKQALILTVFSALVALTLLRGDGHSSVILRCSPLDWIIQALFLLICLLAVTIAGHILSRENMIRSEAGLPLDINWTPSTILKFSAISITIGIISGSLGLGGGVVITPLLFSNGQPPSVASLTSVYIIFFTSFSGFIQFMVIGTLNYEYALFNGAFVLVGSMLGLWLIGSWIQRSNKQSVLVFLLTVVVIFALCSVVVFEILKAQKKVHNGEDIWAFAEFCPS